MAEETLTKLKDIGAEFNSIKTKEGEALKEPLKAVLKKILALWKVKNTEEEVIDSLYLETARMVEVGLSGKAIAIVNDLDQEEIVQ